MKRSPQRSQQQNSLNEDILEFIEQAEDNVINVQNQENFSSSKNKKPRIQKSKRMLSEEVLFQSSSMDEPLSSLKSENKKSSFSDSFSQEEFNLKEDLKIERSKKGYDSSHKQYTYTKKIIDFPKKNIKEVNLILKEKNLYIIIDIIILKSIILRMRYMMMKMMRMKKLIELIEGKKIFLVEKIPLIIMILILILIIIVKLVLSIKFQVVIKIN